MFLIYLIYFRSDGGNLNSALKILKGLNSDIFNYMETNKYKLKVDNSIPVFFDSWMASRYDEVKKDMPFNVP